MVLFFGIHLDKSLIDALHETKKMGCNVLQIYMGNKRLTTLREKYTFTKDEINEIKLFIKDNNIKFVVHSILTLNYCRDPSSMRNQWGIDNLVYDMNLCYKLSGIGVVVHMGTHKTPKVNVTYNECVNNFIKSIKIVLEKTKKIPIILETPVNRKNIVGGTLEGLSQLYNSIPKEYKKRVKICVDTQHIFASGYNMSNYEKTTIYFKKFDELIGIKNLALIHLNDSEKELNSKINRHAPIGKGYIFSDNNNKSLSYIVNFVNKYKIPMLLETNYENYKYEIKYIKSLLNNAIQQVGSSSAIQHISSKNIKQLILKIFKSILSYYETLGKTGNISTKFRIDSYRKAIKTIELYNKPIYNSKNIKDLPSIGKGFCEKINIISKNGTLQIYENIKKNNKSEKIIKFQSIFGIGPEKARYIVSKNIYTIKDLQNAVKQNKIQLSEQQLLGLKYYKDLNKKIPRSEITEYTKIIKKLIETKNIHIYNAGSYRAGKDISGDIDLIISYKNSTLEKISSIFYNKLKDANIIINTLSTGSKKSIYIVKLPNKCYRKIDVAYVEEELLPWYLLYFGSSRDFSKKIRNIASKLGYKLNEKGLFDKKSGNKINFIPNEEKDIFTYLNIEYVKPEDRI